MYDEHFHKERKCGLDRYLRMCSARDHSWRRDVVLIPFHATHIDQRRCKRHSIIIDSNIYFSVYPTRALDSSLSTSISLVLDVPV